MRNSWKKTAAFLLAFTLAAVPLSQTGVKGGLFGVRSIVAHATSNISGNGINISGNDSGTLSSDMTCTELGLLDHATLTINKGITLTLNINDDGDFNLMDNSKIELHGELAGSVSYEYYTWGRNSYINVYLSDGAKYTVTGLSFGEEDNYLRYYGYDAATDGNGTVGVKNGDTAVTSKSIGYKTTTYTYTATPASGYKFKNWTKGAGGEVIGTDASIDVTCAQNGQYQVYANFEEDVVAPTIYGPSVTLGDDLALNIYVDGIANDTEAAEYTMNFTGACVDSSSALSYNEKEGKYYATTHVYAKDIDKDITATLCKGSDTIDTLEDYSITQYLSSPAFSEADEKTTALLTATQNFGNASAEYFYDDNYGVTATFADYNPDVSAYATTFSSDEAKLSLVLDSKTAARLYVKGDTTGTDSTINATKAEYPTYHEITELLPQNLADEQTITVGDRDYTFSALSWCNRVLNSTSASQKNINMAKAIMAYYTAAKNYTTAENPVPATITVTGTLDDPDDYLIEDDPFAFTAATSGGDNKFVADWTENEHIAVLYEVGGTKKVADATITAVDYDDLSATIQFTVEEGTPDNTPCTLVYPYSAAKDDYSGVKDAATLLAAQDGTLSANLDVRVGEGTIQTTTPGLTVTTQPEAQFAIFKFTTQSKTGEYGSLQNTNVTKLTVTTGGQDYVITPASANSTLYAALPAVSGQTVSFTATDGSNLYAASKASVSFAAAKYYKSTVKMGKVIEVFDLSDPFIDDFIGPMPSYHYLHIGLDQAYAIAKQLSAQNSGATVAVVYNHDKTDATYALSSDASATAHTDDLLDLFDPYNYRVFLATLWEE